MRPQVSRDWSLRLARESDATGMAALALGASDPVRLIRKGHSLVVHVGERLAGALLAEPFRRELHLWHLAVATPFRGMGIGSGLVRAAQIDARNTGMKALTLTTDREEGAPFFAQLCFEEVTALDAHIRLAGELAVEVDDGLAPERRCAMICFLD
jgi:N-acetylglutamate synthase-like GNAT family acetyltransferase